VGLRQVTAQLPQIALHGAENLFLASVIGLIVMFYAYAMPAWAP